MNVVTRWHSGTVCRKPKTGNGVQVMRAWRGVFFSDGQRAEAPTGRVVPPYEGNPGG